jgi:hypothetical protein
MRRSPKKKNGWRFLLPAVQVPIPTKVQALSPEELPVPTMATTMEFATSVESSIAMKSAVAVELASAPAVMIPATSAEAAAAPIIAIPIAVPAAPIKTATIPARMTPIPVIPGAYANEYAVHKPFRPIVAVRRAGVRIIVIISIGANRRWANISRAVVAGTHAHADKYSLRARKRRAKQANAE